MNIESQQDASTGNSSPRVREHSEEQWTIRNASVLEEHIADRQQYRKLRHYAFFGVTFLIFGLVAMFAWWVRAFGLRVFGESVQTSPPQAVLLVMPLVVIASLVAVSLLPLIRLVFREPGEKEDDRDEPTLWQALLKELADLFKQYLNRSKPAT
ncbi:hypothetical protein [Caballeronia sp. LZ035]|uniref:hypothetical protein n=1 Tax=Caballeronia sp. LZ035 TaxID=3038568 RepID=UPI002864B920|nr:hypothetical protein [Caballeronia sp. LZ035]MDR5757854.1 hypothetical protein [Caballeronia sp. LZ035]